MSDFAVKYGTFSNRAKAMSNFLLAGRIFEQWFPGRQVGNEWSALNHIRGDKSPDSFNINVATGIWKDFASGDCGADLVDLYAYYRSLSEKSALEELEEKYGVKGESVEADRSNIKVVHEVIDFNVAKSECRNFDLYDGHGGYLKPSATYTYRTENGDLIGYKVVYKPGRNGKEKEALPWTYSDNRIWVMTEEGFHKRKPLYGMEKFKDVRENILIVEGEKCADKAQEILGDEWVVVSWHGGTSCAQKAEWDVLPFSKNLYLWPDDDYPKKEGSKTGLKAMEEIRIILGRGVILDPKPINKLSTHGWDVADAIEEGWTKEMLVDFITKQSAPEEQTTAKVESSKVPREISKIYDWIIKVSNEKHHKFAIQSCFCLLSAITNGSYAGPTNCCLSIYSLLISQASGGKGAYIEKMMSIVRRIAPLNITGEQGSRQALRSQMMRKSNVLTMYNGELGLGLARVLVDNGVGSQQSQDYLDFWGKLEMAEGLATKEAQDPDVPHPRLSIYGGTTMATFRDILSRRGSVSNGFISRLDPIISNVINVDDDSDECDDPLDEWSMELLRKIAKLTTDQYVAMNTEEKKTGVTIQQKRVVKYGEGVKVLYKEYKKLCKQRKKTHSDNNDMVLSDIYGRCSEKSLRYASLLAIAGNPDNPVMTVEHFLFAKDWVEQFTAQLVEEAGVYGNTSVQVRIKQAVIRYLKKAMLNSATMRDIRKGTLLRDEDVDVVKKVMSSMESDGLITSAQCSKKTIWTLTKEGKSE